MLSDSDSDAGSDSELDVDVDSDTDTKIQPVLSSPHKNGKALKPRKRNKDSPQKRIEVENPAKVLSTPKKSPKKLNGKSQDKLKEKKLAEGFVDQDRDTGTSKNLPTGQNIPEVTEGQKKTKVRRQMHIEDGNFKTEVLSPQIADKHTPQKNMEKDTVTETPKSQRKKSRVQQSGVEELLPGVPKSQEDKNPKVVTPKQNIKEDITDRPSEEWEGSSEVLEMILVKDVSKGAEVCGTVPAVNCAWI